MLTILMTTFGQLDLTKKAIESLLKYTNKSDYKLYVFVNKKGDRATNAYLGSLSDCSIIESNKNRGWIESHNSIYENINTDFFLTCHNDIEFTEDWLPKMMRRFSDPKVAIVGPTSNFIKYLQDFRYNIPGLVTEDTGMVCGLFSIFRKSAIDKLIAQDDYFMDPIFGLGDKEEDDYCIRLKRLGYTFKIARDVLIPHCGERGFADALGSTEKFHAYQNKNQKLLINKWGQAEVDKLYSVDMTSRLIVLVGIPFRNELCHNDFAMSLSLMRKPGTRFEYADVSRYIVHEARNKVVEKALEIGAHYVLFVDNDMQFSPNAAIQLMNHDVDIVCGNFFQRAYPYYPTIFKLNENNETFQTIMLNQGLQEIDACGMAFTLIKTEIFKRVKKPWFVYGHAGLDIYQNEGGLSEDLSFCIRAKQHFKYKVYCDTDLIITHIGMNKKVDDKMCVRFLDLDETNKSISAMETLSNVDERTVTKEEWKSVALKYKALLKGTTYID